MDFLKINNSLVLNKFDQVYIFEKMEHIMGDGDLIINMYKLCGIIIGVAILYWLFYIPCNWKKHMHYISKTTLLRRSYRPIFI
ncbi:hypothetical protein CVS40_7882 [Lucilia cuprina]|nr:hypothetical protein CVS40_7882 [Lucilia cuprina]